MTSPASPTPAGKPTSSKPRRQRLLRVVLFVSLALNLLVVGLVLGAVVTRGSDMPGRQVMLDLSFGPYTRALAPADRAALRDAWRDQSVNWWDIREAHRAELDAFVAALRAEPFDLTEVETILDRQHTRQSEQRQLARTILSERLTSMSPSDRAAYADRLEAASREPPQRRGRPPDSTP